MNKSQHPETTCFTVMGQSPTGSTALPSLCSNLGAYSLIFSQNQTQGPHLRVSPSRWGSPQLADHPQSLFPSVEKQLKKQAGPPASGPKSDLLTGGSAEQEVFPDSPERPNMKPLPTWKSDRLKHQALSSKEKSLTLDNVPSTGGTGFLMPSWYIRELFASLRMVDRRGKLLAQLLPSTRLQNCCSRHYSGEPLYTHRVRGTAIPFPHRNVSFFICGVCC